MNEKEAIIELLMLRQTEFKEMYEELTIIKQELLIGKHAIFQNEIEEQYECILKRNISFKIADSLAIPIENVIIILEDINLYDYLKV